MKKIVFIALFSLSFFCTCKRDLRNLQSFESLKKENSTNFVVDVYVHVPMLENSVAVMIPIGEVPAILIIVRQIVVHIVSDANPH